MAETQAKPRPDPYALCPCGSGVKYKFCECRLREAGGPDAGAEEAGPPPPEHHRQQLCQYYRAGKHSGPALDRRDFRWLTNRMGSEGRSILHIYDPRNLGGRAEHLHAALDHLEHLGIQASFRCDPTVEVMTFLQHLLDLLSTEGAYRVRGSGELWGRAGRNSWRIDRQGVPTAFCGRDNPLGFALLGARCQDLRAEGYELPIPLLRIVAGATLFAEIAQMAKQIRDLAASDLPGDVEDGVVISAPALFGEVAQSDTALPPSPDGDPSSSPAALLACALAFEGSLAAPEAAVAGYALSDAARSEYVTALRRAATCPPVVELVGLVPELGHPPDRGGALQLLEALRERGNALADQSLDPGEALSLGINAPALRGVQDYVVAAPASPVESTDALPEAPIPLPFETNLGTETIGEAVPTELTMRLDELISSRRETDPFATISEPAAALEAEELEAQGALEAARLAAGEAGGQVRQLRDELEQVKSNLAKAEQLGRLCRANCDEAEHRVHNLQAQHDEARVTALAGAMTDSLDTLELAAQVEQQTGFDIHRLLDDPEVARFHQTVSDYERMQREEILASLPESALQAIQRAVSEAQQALAGLTPAAAARRSVVVPVAVSANISTDGGGHERLSVGILGPVPPGGVAGPLGRLVIRLARGVKDLITYLDVDPATVTITQHGCLGGGMLIEVECPAPASGGAAAAAEAAAVLIEAAVEDDANAPLPTLLDPRVRELPARLLATARVRASAVAPSAADRAQGNGALDLDTAAARVGVSPLELALHLALGGVLLEDDGEVDPGALQTLAASAGRRG